MHFYRQRPAGPSANRAVIRPSAPIIMCLTLAALLVATVLVANNRNSSSTVLNLAAPGDYITAELAAKPQGVDVSRWQHPSPQSINWNVAAGAGKKFTYIKATEGISKANEHRDSDVQLARQAGVHVGLYHMARPGTDAIDQADAFAAEVLAVGGKQLPPVLDLEHNDGLPPAALAAWTRTFLQRLEEKTGRKPILYTYKYFWLVQMANTTEFSEYPLWLAEYQQRQPTVPNLGGWKSWTFWQYAGNDGRAPGFPTAIDLNVFNGTQAQLDSLVSGVGPQAARKPSTVEEPSNDGAALKSPSNVPSVQPGEAKPLTLTIPNVQLARDLLPAGISLPLRIVLPTELLGGELSGWLNNLLSKLPTEVLKAIEFS